MLITALLSLSLSLHAQEPPPPPEVSVPPSCPSRPWPGDWSDGAARTTADHADAVAALDAWAFPTPSSEADAARQGIRTEGLLVIQGDEILYERYGRGFTADKRHLTWSASKTFVNALAGIAVRDGLVSLDDSICDHIEATNPDNCVVTVADLLSFGSGLSWRETYEGDPPTTSSVVSMLYGDGIGDMAAFISSAERASEPGTTWQYSSGDTTLLSAVLGAAMAPKHGRDFPWSALFDPLGMSSVTWERDGAGTIVGSSYLYGTPRELARFGRLWRDDGCWDGERMLPEGWVARSTTVSDPIQQTALDREGGTQGWQVWLNQPVYALGDTAAPWDHAPADAYAAQGHWKQRIIVVPSHDLIIIRVGDDRDGSFKNGDLFRLVMPLVVPLTEPAATPTPPTGPATGTLSESVPLKFDTGLLRIGASYGAKLACSCLFVMEQDEAYCRAWVKASPDIVRLSINTEEKIVTVRALGLVRARASWVDERSGCQLE
ncbi:MAG: CubicO group peptidase (beta-lactamase class C family) [Myxococcota bacterium]|jgi:CubicO group peptidase (beta-lactamase class C family)